MCFKHAVSSRGRQSGFFEIFRVCCFSKRVHAFPIDILKPQREREIEAVRFSEIQFEFANGKRIGRMPMPQGMCSK